MQSFEQFTHNVLAEVPLLCRKEEISLDDLKNTLGKILMQKNKEQAKNKEVKQNEK